MDISGLHTRQVLDTWAPDFAAGLMKDLEQVTTHFYSAWRMGVTVSFTKIPQSMDEKCCSRGGVHFFSPDLFLFTSLLPDSRVAESLAFLLAYIKY